MQEPQTIAPSVFTLFNAISLIASVVSLVLSLLAIWLTLRFKSDADKVNQDTTKLLIEIRSDAKAITEGVMSELRAYGDAMRGTFAHNVVNEPLSVVLSKPSGLQVSGNRDEQATPTSVDAVQSIDLAAP